MTLHVGIITSGPRLAWLRVFLTVIVCVGWLPEVTSSWWGYDIDETNEASDCRQEFLSSQSKNGTFKSPHYPNPYPDINRCHYIFQGQGKERIQIKFEVLDLDFNSNTNPDVNCDDEDSVLVSIKIDGAAREIGHYCGNQQPEILMSNTNQLEVQFITRNRDNQPIQAKGFLATYKFVTDFGIKTGRQDPNIVCGFEYKSTDAFNGTFTSPNYPGFYPRETECHYIFIGRSNERVYIDFPVFDVEGVLPHCDEGTDSDYVEFSNFNIPDRKMNRFCGVGENDEKKKVHSDGSFFRVIFKSNHRYDARGFIARYRFVATATENKDPSQTTQSRTGTTQPIGQAPSQTTPSATCLIISTLYISLLLS